MLGSELLQLVARGGELAELLHALNQDLRSIADLIFGKLSGRRSADVGPLLKDAFEVPLASDEKNIWVQHRAQSPLAEAVPNVSDEVGAGLDVRILLAPLEEVARLDVRRVIHRGAKVRLTDLDHHTELPGVQLVTCSGTQDCFQVDDLGPGGFGDVRRGRARRCVFCCGGHG